MTALVSVKYDRIMPFYNTDYTLAIVNGKAGMIDLEGNPLTDFIYDDLSEQYLNLQEGAWTIYHNCCSLSLNGKWGLLDGKGRIIIEFMYDNNIDITYSPSCDNLCFVKTDGKYAIYNTEWQKVTDKYYDKLSFLNDGIVFSDNGKFGVMDFDCNIKHEAIYDKILQFLHINKDMVVCVRNGLYGIIRTNGDTVINCIFDKLSLFSNSGRFICAKKPKCNYWGVIDLYNMKLLLDYEFEKVEFCCSNSKEQEYFLTQKDNITILYDITGKRIC